MPADFGVYVHWPFCLRKCPYCDFNSHVGTAADPGRWRAALVAEIDHAAAEAPGRTVSSVFFGGGTPSLMEPAVVGAVLERIAARWALAPGAEVTLEANPGTAEAARFADFRAAGVNRLSVGVQSFDDGALGFLGRVHGAAEARAALGLAARHFPRFSLDLIYARPGQTAAAWRRELVEALAFAPAHLSAYQLVIEAGTAFHRSGVAAADEETAADLYETTREVLAGAGLPAYEVSNHARPGAECRHNLLYWRGGDYAGIGPGAHGRITRDGVTCAIRRHANPEGWLKAVEAAGHGTKDRVPLGPRERRDEVLLMGLRLSEGIDRARFRALVGREIESALAADRLARLVDGGFLVLDGGGLRCTAAGLRRLDAVLAALLD
jgi:oxygen-independent coproporphyrinogen-3 oxidase